MHKYRRPVTKRIAYNQVASLHYNRCCLIYSPPMRLQQFDFDLPKELIAQCPLEERVASKLLCFDRLSGQCNQHMFADLPDFLKPGDVVVVNDTRVIPARLATVKPTGGKVEIMLERQLEDNRILVQARSGKSLRSGQELILAEYKLVVEGRKDRFYILQLPAETNTESLFGRFGTIPLPPYIERRPEATDEERYQTVFSQHPGAVAAPTAGLHFDRPLIQRIKDKGAKWETVTLHVGAGTFLPMQQDHLEDHVMHAEKVIIDQGTCDRINRAKQHRGRVIAIGTTTVRSLESAAQSGELLPFNGDTNLFIKPGYRFRVVDMMVTNFHLPRSSLLVMVSAFAGLQQIRQMYQHAVDNRLRFFSYGDAMILERDGEV